MTTYAQAQLAYFFCTFILYLKVQHANFYAASLRLKSGVGRSKEDQAVVDQRALRSETDRAEAAEKSARWDRVFANDMENIPMVAILGLAALGLADPAMHIVCYTLFTVLRLLHTVAYAHGLQPWRSIFFFASLLAAIVLFVESIVQGSSAITSA